MIRILGRTLKSDTIDKFGKMYAVPRGELWAVRLPLGWSLVKEEGDNDYRARISDKIKKMGTSSMGPGFPIFGVIQQRDTTTDCLNRLGRDLEVERKRKIIKLPFRIKLIKREEDEMHRKRLLKVLKNRLEKLNRGNEVEK